MNSCDTQDPADLAAPATAGRPELTRGGCRDTAHAFTYRMPCRDTAAGPCGIYAEQQLDTGDTAPDAGRRNWRGAGIEAITV